VNTRKQVNLMVGDLRRLGAVSMPSFDDIEASYQTFLDENSLIHSADIRKAYLEGVSYGVNTGAKVMQDIHQVHAQQVPVAQVKSSLLNLWGLLA